MFVTVDCGNIVHTACMFVCVCECVYVCVCVCALYIHAKCHLSSFSVSLTVDIEPQATELVAPSGAAEQILDATALNMLGVHSAVSIVPCP